MVTTTTTTTARQRELKHKQDESKQQFREKLNQP